MIDTLDPGVNCSATAGFNQQNTPADADVLVNDEVDNVPARSGRRPDRISCRPTLRAPAAIGLVRILSRHPRGDTRATTQATLTAIGTDDTAAALPVIEIEAAPAAHCCGAAGCHTTEDLQKVTIDGRGTWVICPDHLDELVERETGLTC